ncbi:MazG-like family protein [Streptomyces antibioticus]|uniref:MazG-like family protein n=1 Tax=Streptomyces antibioticus TaxID=1890 RepID=UPI000A4C9D70
MTATPDTHLWLTIDALWTWLESDQPVSGREGLLLRVLKLSEEVGEVAQAIIGATGQNPRKGTTHTWDDVQSELCDTAITALVALRTLTPEPERVFAEHLAGVAERSLGGAETVRSPTETTSARPRSPKSVAELEGCRPREARAGL